MARKNKKKRGALSSAEIQERRQRQLEERRRQRAEALAAEERRARRERVIRIGVLLVVAGGLLWFFLLRPKGVSEINGHPVASFSTTGKGDHRASGFTYETTPPVSGAHSQQAAPCGVLGEQVPDETQVHSLEHGAVGIQYLPDLAQNDIRQIEAIARAASENVFSAPYVGAEAPIVVTSWGRMMRLDTLDVAAINEYIDEFAGEGPERDQRCPNDVDEPFVAPVVSPSPGTAPSPIPPTPLPVSPTQ